MNASLLDRLGELGAVRTTALLGIGDRLTRRSPTPGKPRGCPRHRPARFAHTTRQCRQRRHGLRAGDDAPAEYRNPAAPPPEVIQVPERVLIVTDEHLADENQVPEPIRPLIDHAEDIYVIAPTLTTRLQSLTGDIDRARASADTRLRTVFDHMHSSGFDAHGTVGDEDQLSAVADALSEFDADLILLRLHAPRQRERELARAPARQPGPLALQPTDDRPLLRPGRARGGTPRRLAHRPLGSAIVPTVSRNEVDVGRP